MFSSTEGQYLLNSLQGNFNNTPEHLDENQFLELLNQHKLSIWFFNSASKKAPAVLKKYNHLAAALKNLFAQNTLKSLGKCAEQIKINQEFKAHNIQSIFLKGEGLSQQIYDEPNARMSGDIDILIDSKMLVKADECLKALGYIRKGTSEVLFKWFKPILFWVQKDVIYIHPQKKIMIELHWRFECDQFCMRAPFETLWQQRSSVKFHNIDIPVLGPEDNAVYLCFHGAKHGYLKFQWLLDIKNYFEKFQLTPDTILQRAKQYRVEPHCFLTAYLLDKYTGTSFNLRPESSASRRLNYSVEYILRNPPSQKRRLYFAFIFMPQLHKNLLLLFPRIMRVCVEKLLYCF